MSYVLVNSSSLRPAEQAACEIKVKLQTHFEEDVLIVSDFMSETARGQALYREIQMPSVRTARAMEIILEQRKAILQCLVAPAVAKGTRVLYVGGILDDSRYAKIMEFHDILKANQEALAELGDLAQPLGAVYAKHTLDLPNVSRGYYKRADRLMGNKAGMKLVNYDQAHATLIKIHSLFP